MATEKNQVSWQWWVLISLILFATVGTLLYYVILLKTDRGLPPEIVLGVALVIGVIALIIALTFMTVIFRSLDLTNSENSLGLPEGSVRAVIALSLILIFMISSVFLYFDVKHSDTFISVGITQGQIDNMPQERIVAIERLVTINNETLFKVTRLVENQPSEDIAKQIITTISTLVVAIAGFYFGTKAVATTKGGAPVVSVPVIRKTDPTELKQEEEKDDFKIFGKNFDLAKEVKLIHDSIIKQCTGVTSSSTMITCKLKIDEKDPVGKWTVVVINSDGGEDRLEGAFEVKQK